MATMAAYDPRSRMRVGLGLSPRENSFNVKYQLQGELLTHVHSPYKTLNGLQGQEQISHSYLIAWHA